MDYSRPELADRLAAEYVTGTLRGRARRRFEALLPSHPALRRAVADWERRAQPLLDAVPEVKPRPQVWEAVQAQVWGETALTPPAPTAAAQRAARWWQRLGLWQGATGLATAALVASLVLSPRASEVPPPIVIVMNANPDAGAGAVPARFVASLGADGRSLVLKPLDVPAIEATRALELWAVPSDGAPRSLGLVSADQGAVIRRAGLLTGTAAFAVSLEPAGGSPTGAPTGPILSLGRVAL
ncbi:MAG: anti-sigma factor [Rubrivivax sp.]|jgi:anti-sigma-K factor RskA